MIKVGISGIPGSGKSTLARALAGSFCGKKSVELVSEYAREYLSKHKKIDIIWEQLWVTEKQIEREENIVQNVEILITDSPIYLGFLFASDLVDFKNKKDLVAYNELFEKLINLNNRYDYIFHLNPDIKPVKDGVRPAEHFDEVWRLHANSSILSNFKVFGQDNVIEIKNDNIDERISKCLEVLK